MTSTQDHNTHSSLRGTDSNNMPSTLYQITASLRDTEADTTPSPDYQTTHATIRNVESDVMPSMQYDEHTSRAHANIRDVASLPAYHYTISDHGSVDSLPLPSRPGPAYPYANSNRSSMTTLPAYEEESDEKNLVPKNEKSANLPVMEGWVLWMTVFSLCLSLMIATLDTTIISTSLITIVSDFGHFDKASWVVVAYLLTYSGFLIIFTRMSDIFGRKPVILFAVLMFLFWSLACGLAKSIEQLVLFRALQGIGGAGIYALAYASILDIVPHRLVAAASGAISMSTACASLLGPVVGGVITSHTTWRWVFLINVPCGVIVTVCIVCIFPGTILPSRFTKSAVKKIDGPGIILSLAGSSLLVVSLSMGGSQYAWNSVFVITMLSASTACFIGYGIWETMLTKREGKWEMLPLFPSRLVSHRVIAATLLTVFFTGVPFVVTVLGLPTRFQIVNNDSPETAGLHLLPLIMTTAFGAIVAGAVTGKFNCAWHLLVFSNILVAVGCGLLSILPTGEAMPKLSYVYQAIMGLGFGFTMSCSMVVARAEVAAKDNAVSVGAITQLRQFGGVIGFSVTTAVLDQSFRNQLVNVLTPQQLSAVLLSTANIATLSDADATITRAAYGIASNLQMRTVMGFACAAFVTSLFAYGGKSIPKQPANPADQNEKSTKDVESQSLPDYEEFISYRYNQGSMFKDPVVVIPEPQRSVSLSRPKAPKLKVFIPRDTSPVPKEVANPTGIEQSIPARAYTITRSKSIKRKQPVIRPQLEPSAAVPKSFRLPIVIQHDATVLNKTESTRQSLAMPHVAIPEPLRLPTRDISNNWWGTHTIPNGTLFHSTEVSTLWPEQRAQVDRDAIWGDMSRGNWL